MGGQPFTALAIAGFPESGLGRSNRRGVQRRRFDKLREAGVALLGGHTVRDRGDQVRLRRLTGAIDPGRVLANGGQADVLYPHRR